MDNLIIYNTDDGQSCVSLSVSDDDTVKNLSGLATHFGIFVFQFATNISGCPDANPGSLKTN